MKFLKWAAGLLLALCVVLATVGYGYVESLDLDQEVQGNRQAQATDLPFVRDGVREPRGRVLAVVSSTARFDEGRRKGGYELTELARAYWVFVANGYEVDIASPRGGEPPQVLDDGLVDADYAFLNDATAQAKLAATLPLADVDPARYDAVYFVGGKGAMVDFRGNPDIARIIGAIEPRGVVGAVCHGPAALLDVVLADGRPLLQGRRVTGFTNAEELFLIEDAEIAFGYLLQDALAAQADRFVEGPLYLDNAVVDGRLGTGQNPWPTWSVAEAMVRALGHEPVPRETTAEEVSVQLLGIHHAEGLDEALRRKTELPRASKHLLLMHALVAASEFDLFVLDVNLPGQDGIALCEALRQGPGDPVPAIFLSARGGLEDKLRGFAAGAIDYMVKPFAPAELLARIRAVRAHARAPAAAALVVGGYSLDVRSGLLSRDGRQLQLHASGLEILRRLMQAHPRSVSKQSLAEGLWGDEAPGSDPLRTHVYLLRQALQERFGDAPVFTERGIGYRFGAPE